MLLLPAGLVITSDCALVTLIELVFFLKNLDSRKKTRSSEDHPRTPTAEQVREMRYSRCVNYLFLDASESVTFIINCYKDRPRRNDDQR